jgi:GTPase
MHLTKQDYLKCIETITSVTNKLEADFANIDELNQLDTTATLVNDENNIVAHLMIRKRPKSVQDLLEIRVAVVGNVDAGKVMITIKSIAILLTTRCLIPCYIVNAIRCINKRSIG